MLCRRSLTAMLLLLANVMCSPQQGPHPRASDKTNQTPDANLPVSPGDDEKGFVSLFDGRSLAGWQGTVQDYEAADGILICKQGAHGNLYTDRQYGDFILRLEYRLGPGGNNGIGIRTPVSEQPPAVTGLEIQILDDSFPEYQGTLQPVQFNGSVYGAVAAKQGHMKPVGQWNEMEIVAKGPRIQVTLNGALIVDADMDTVGPVQMHGFDFVGLHNKRGHIAICGHTHRVEFRNLRIKELE